MLNGWLKSGVIAKVMSPGGYESVLMRGASASFLVMVAGTFAAFGLQILLARLLGVEHYGIYIYALTWMSILTLVCKLGLETSLVRFIPTYLVNGEWELLRGLMGRSVRYVMAMSVGIGLCAAALIWMLRDRIGEITAVTFWIALLALPLMALVGIRQAALRAFKRMVQAALPEGVVRQVLIAIPALVLWVGMPQSASAPVLMSINLIATLITFALGSLWLLRAMPVEALGIAPRYADREWLRVSMPLFFMSGMYLILNQTDVVMLGILQDPEEAGIYAVASRIATLATFGLMAANSIVAPMISELYSSRQHEALQRVVAISARWVFAFMLLAGGAIALAGRSILGLFGEQFVAGYVPLLVLLLGHAANSLTGSVGFIMTMTGYERQAAWIVGISAGANLLLNVVLIPHYGMVGAAVATAVTMASWNGAMLLYVLRRLNINPTVLAKV